MTEPVAFLNGRWIPASAAAVPVGDAGFILGATVAEQLRTFAGRLFRLDEHLARLAHSLEIVGVAPGTTLDELGAIATELATRNHPLLPSGGDLALTILVTPGEYAALARPGAARPTVCLHTHALSFHLWARKYREGQSLVTTAIEQVPSVCWPAELKCRSRMHYYLADRQAAAREPGARALLLDAQGFVAEASTANLLIYTAREGLVSPPSSKILRGISLAVVVELAEELKIPVVFRDLTPDEVAGADEALLSSTPTCLVPVTRFNGRPIADGRPGDVFRRLMTAWSAAVGIDIMAQAEGQGNAGPA